MKIVLSLLVSLAFSSYVSANNTKNIPECAINDDCAEDRVCANELCVDPCASVCGNNTVCHVTKHVAMCSCNPGYSGHPALGCSRIVVPECVSNNDCAGNRVCDKERCVDPCASTCGANNTQCHVVNHVAMCSCKSGYAGHPVTGCTELPTACLSPRTGKKLFILFSEVVDWTTALMSCIRNNYQLAAIEDANELEKLENQIKTEGFGRSQFWVSGSDVDSEGNHIWASNGKKIDTSLWYHGEPNNVNGREHCVELRKEYDLTPFRLNDNECNRTFSFICQAIE